MTMDEVKGNEVKILWICGLFGLLSLVAYGRIATTLNDRALAQSAMRMSPSGATPPAGTIVLDGPTGISRIAARSTRAQAAAPAEASSMAPDLSLYLQLHETRAIEALPVSARANLCPG
jgi:hypothetical protein